MSVVVICGGPEFRRYRGSNSARFVVAFESSDKPQQCDSIDCMYGDLLEIVFVHRKILFNHTADFVTLQERPV